MNAKRIRQMVGCWLLTAASATCGQTHPNVLVIITDQQQAGMLGCAGNPYVKTPNLDRLAQTGARFERAYCGNLVCVPSRFCMLSGTLPSVIGMETNGQIDNPVPQSILDSALGSVFARAGYRTVYGGKTHVPGAKKPNRVADYGLETICSNDREELSGAGAAFLREKHDKPFLLVASFINPHDRAKSKSRRMRRCKE